MTGEQLPGITPGPQTGFTLVELMVSTALMAVLILVVMVLFNQTLLLTQTMLRRIAFNTEARLAFNLLADGGMRSFGPDTDGLYVYNTGHPHNEDVIRGFRQGQTIPVAAEDASFKVTGLQSVFWDGSSNQANNSMPWLCFNQLQWSRTTTDANPLSTSSAPPSVNCATSPHPSCTIQGCLTMANSSKHAIGSVFMSTFTDRQTFPRQAVDVKLELVDPSYMAANTIFQESDASFVSIPAEARETYRTSFYLAGSP